MQVFRKIMALALALTLILSMGMMTALAEPASDAERLVLSAKTLTLRVGESTKLKVISPGVSSAAWHVAESEIAIIGGGSSSGYMEITVTAMKPGTTTINALHHEYSSGVCTVIVRPKIEPNIRINSRYVQTTVGRTSDLSVTAVGVSSVNWSSDNPSVVAVEAVGDGYEMAKITALKVGTAIITAQNDDGSITDTCPIEVVEVGGVYHRPGETLSFSHNAFQKKSDKTPMPELGWRFSTEFLEITSQKIDKGANLVKRIGIDDDDACINLYLNQNYNLVSPKEPNLIFGTFELTVKKDSPDRLIKGEVFEFIPAAKENRIGYQPVSVVLGTETLEYLSDYITTFVAGNGVTSGTASFSDESGNIYIEGEVRAGDKVLVAIDNKLSMSREYMAKFPDVNMIFYNINTNGFPRANDLQLCAEPNEFVYKVADGKLMNSGLTWSDKDYAWVGKITESTSFLVSDKKLSNITTPDDKPSGGGDDDDKPSGDGDDDKPSGDGDGGKPTDPEKPIDPKPDPDDKPSSGGGSTGGNNTANTPATSDKVNSTVEALKNPTAALPKDVVKTTTAGGAAITTIPVAMTTGSATVGSSLFNTLGSAPATVGLKLTVSNGMYGGSMEVIIPGGFGKITEPGRFSFPMDYNATAEHSSTMTSAVKGDNAVSMTAKVGGNFTLPVTATVTVPTKLAEGSTVNIYKYDPLTNKMISIGKAVVKNGKLTFATKMMGEMLFTTGTV